MNTYGNSNNEKSPDWFSNCNMSKSIYINLYTSCRHVYICLSIACLSFHVVLPYVLYTQILVGQLTVHICSGSFEKTIRKAKQLNLKCTYTRYWTLDHTRTHTTTTTTATNVRHLNFNFCFLSYFSTVWFNFGTTAYVRLWVVWYAGVCLLLLEI